VIIFSPDAVEDIERLRLFLEQTSPTAAQRAMAQILVAIERLKEFPDLGMSTKDADIRQIVIRFGSSGYVIRYAVSADNSDILITRIWHGRETRP
jgi:toxin ParE1/3/4